MYISHSTTQSLWNSGRIKVHQLLYFVDMVPDGVVQIVVVPLIAFLRNLLACFEAIRLPEAPESNRHFRVIGFALPSLELSLANTMGLTSFVICFLC